jgi:hypothetical protein
MPADTPTKHVDAQAAMKTHLSQPTGGGAFDGQHGMSLAISFIVAGADGVIPDDVRSSAIAGIEGLEGVSAMTGRETGASAKPAITRIASNRRRAESCFTASTSHGFVAAKGLLSGNSTRRALIGIKSPGIG